MQFLLKISNFKAQRHREIDTMKNHNGNFTPRTAFGLGLIAFAVLLFLSNIGIPFLGVVLRNWPVVLIVVGAVMFQHAKKKNTKGNKSDYLPHTLIAIGILFQLANMHILNFGIGAIVVPIVLAFVGINLLRSQSTSSHRQNRDKHQDDTQGQVIDGELISDDSSAAEADATQSNTHSDDTKIDVFTVLGGGNFSTRSKRLTNGNIIAILGGAEVDIREADSLKNTLEIDIVAFMGGVEIKVPPHFNVTVKLLPLLGGVTNKTTCLADKMGVPAKHLVLTGMALMGGVEITN